MPQTDSKRSSGEEQQQTVQMAPYPYPQQIEDDTIDLYELWFALWNRKWLVIVVTVVAALGSVVYALQQQHIYKAEALLLPPKLKNVQLFKLTVLPNATSFTCPENEMESTNSILENPVPVNSRSKLMSELFSSA